MRQPQLALKRASVDDLGTVLTLIDTVAQWIRTNKDTNQWESPWPTEEERSKRIQIDLGDGKTWIAWDGNQPVATITADPVEHNVWPEEMLRDPAVYVSRLVVDREYSGNSLGAQLIDWAGLRGKRQFGATWVRVDVWTDNFALHQYYESQGFTFCGFSAIRNYPAAALFQKPTHKIAEPAMRSFREAFGDS